MIINELNLTYVERILALCGINVAPDSDRNPVFQAYLLGLVGLVEIERVETGYYDRADQSVMINDGQVVEPIAFGQRVLQAVTRSEP